MTDNIQFTLNGEIIPDYNIDPVRLPRLLKKHCANYGWNKDRIDRQVSHYDKEVKYGLRCVLSNGKLNKGFDLNELIQMIELAGILNIDLNILFTPNFFKYIDINQLTYVNCLKLIKFQFGIIINNTDILEISDGNIIKITNNSNNKIPPITKCIQVDPCIINYFTNPYIEDFALSVVTKPKESLLSLAKNVTVSENTFIDLSDRNKALRKIAKCNSEHSMSQIFMGFYQGLKNPTRFKSQLFAAILSVEYYFIDYFEIREDLIKALNLIITHEDLNLEGEQTLQILLSFKSFSDYENNIYLTKHHFDLLVAAIIYAAINNSNNCQEYITNYLISDADENCILDYQSSDDEYADIVIEYLSKLYRLNQFETKEILMDNLMRDKLNTALGIGIGMLTKAAIK
jgi:hypothetical protein